MAYDIRFILASESPERRRILGGLGEEFDVIASRFDESSVIEQDPAKRASILAECKAQCIAKLYPDRWVIGVDTLMESADHELLEKPLDADDARRMMRLHSGRTSLVHSAMTLIRGEEKCSGLDTVQVRFRVLSDDDIEHWIALGLYEGRSGAFQIEAEGRGLINGFDGEEEAVIGFPVRLFRELVVGLE